ncbi:Bypass of stop codon protein 6 [Colletotrichum siamense]|uniref:Bypass of stop codon protein 6 n=1 Tax=Colletotrichum siamense TaxID=690259 RepID=UPI001872A622|nr:Bypass of stop codon protein 6 [Colletotrichum siamense]KAF5484974.1 Bypass of stop codon protein 6 [Colletotrichum siamense]
MSPLKLISPISSFLINNRPFRRQRSRAVQPANPEPESDDAHQQATHERWDFPRINIAKLGAIFWCFLLLGSNDSSYGVLIPQIEEYYGITYLQVSLIFLSPVLGFIMSTVSNHAVHLRYGKRGVIIMAGTCHVTAYLVGCFHPPFPVLVVVYILVGLGSGAKTAAWNSFVGGFNKSNELLGLLHGFYGLGATITPVTASALFSQGWHWYQVYYVLVAMAASEFILTLSLFYPQNGKAYREEIGEFRGQQETIVVPLQAMPLGENAGRPPMRRNPSSRVFKAANSFKTSNTWNCLKNRVVLVCSAFLLAYVGSEVALGGWLVTFMIDVRGGSAFASGLTASGFWAGITVGRIILGFVTGRVFKSEKHAVTVYLVCAIIMQLLYWLIPNFISSAIIVAFLGFFLGPVFPAVIVCLSRLLPQRMRVSAIGICSAIGASGASVIPFMVGAIAQAKGVAVLQPIILSVLAVCFLLWLLLPGLPLRTSTVSRHAAEGTI